MNKKVSNANVSITDETQACTKRQRPESILLCSQEMRECSLSTAATLCNSQCSHQHRWSAEFCKHGASPIITVRKTKEQPQPPQRSVSLNQPKAASHPEIKRYSCPSIGICNSPRQPYSSSSSTSTSSRSSPPPVQTSVITGPDPLGWRLRPKSSSAYRHTKRLSLQIPLPVIAPDPKSRRATNPQLDNNLNPDHSLKRKPPLGPKPSRRRHSDSSAFLTSLTSPQVLVTADELRALHLRSVTLPDESDDVFGRVNKEELKVTTRPRKIPPPVPEKTQSARKKAQLIAHSYQSCWVNEQIVYTWVTKPKHFYQRKGETQNGKHENTAIVTLVQEH